ncbi:MAG: HepT-like ribonuclease domain-containing protein [Balneolaceae bacterium]|nr:HepT-like ribonuclease domain-containing protein [Balneolaceae bacterium]
MSERVADNMKKAEGFHNIAVQNYRKINWEIVYTIVHERLDDFRVFVREVNVHIPDYQRYFISQGLLIPP